MVTGDRVVSDLAAPGVKHRSAQGAEDGVSADRGLYVSSSTLWSLPVNLGYVEKETRLDPRSPEASLNKPIDSQVHCVHLQIPLSVFYCKNQLQPIKPVQDSDK